MIWNDTKPFGQIAKNKFKEVNDLGSIKTGSTSYGTNMRLGCMS